VGHDRKWLHLLAFNHSAARQEIQALKLLFIEHTNNIQLQLQA